MLRAAIFALAPVLALHAADTISLRELRVPEKAKDKYAEGQRRLARHDSEGARRRFAEAVAISPDYAAGWNALGVLAGPGSPEAEVDFRRAFACDPEYLDVVVNLGALLLRPGRAEEALDYNRRGALLLANDASVRAQYAMNLYQLGKLNEAEREFEAAKGIDPGLKSLPQLFLAEIYARRGEKDRAVAQLEELLARKPDAPLDATLRAALARLQ